MGIQADLANQAMIKWDHRIRQLQHRLGTASVKSNTIAQRANLFRAIAHPAIQFTAGYFYPGQDTMRRLEMDATKQLRVDLSSLGGDRDSSVDSRSNSSVTLGLW